MTTAKKLRQEEVPLSMKSCWLVLFPPVESNLDKMDCSSSPLPPLLPYFFFALDCQFIMVRRCTSTREWDPQRKSLIDKISYQNQSSPKRENPVDNAPVEVLCSVFIQIWTVMLQHQPLFSSGILKISLNIQYQVLSSTFICFEGGKALSPGKIHKAAVVFTFLVSERLLPCYVAASLHWSIWSFMR